MLERESGPRTSGADLASQVLAFHAREHGGPAAYCDKDMCVTAAFQDFVDFYVNDDR